MSDLKTAVEELMGVIEHLDLEESEAINDDISTIGILANGKLSPGQLQDEDIQWVFAHLLGDIVEALDNQEPDALEAADPPLIAFAEALKKNLGEIKDEDLQEQLDEILAGGDNDDDGQEEEEETEVLEENA